MNTDPRIERAGDRPAHRFGPGVPTHEEFLDRVSVVSVASLSPRAERADDATAAAPPFLFLDNL